MNPAIRFGTVADAGVIARHRARMFEEMGEVSGDDVDALEQASRLDLERLLSSGEYVAWLAEVGGEIASGAGVMRRRLLPRGRELGARQEAYVLNVYTEPAFRRRGLAGALMKEVITWARANHCTRVMLHASMAGRPLYEMLGFSPTNEMRLTL